MTLVPLNSIFDIRYGNQFDLNKLDTSTPEVNLVSRSRKNLGVVAKVKKLDTAVPFDAGLITVTLGGTYLLSSFVQQQPFYTAQNIKVLTPKKEMSLSEKIYYCLAIQANRFRYTSHGREANVTLDTLKVPAQPPAEWKDTPLLSNVDASAEDIKTPALSSRKWEWFTLDQLFIFKKGKRLTKAEMKKGKIPFVGAIAINNGWREFIDHQSLHEANTLTVNYNGSVGEAFYQPVPFYASDDVNVLYPKFSMNKYSGLFICSVIKREKYRFNYGRKWHVDRMMNSHIKLPVTKGGEVDYLFMETFIKSLPFSKGI